MNQRETDSYLIERSLAAYTKKDKAGADLSESFEVTLVFKDLQKLVSQQQRENIRKELSLGCKTSRFGYGINSGIDFKNIL
jgi:hypothetical protein